MKRHRRADHRKVKRTRRQEGPETYHHTMKTSMAHKSAADHKEEESRQRGQRHTTAR
jgi:hypothetical protein